MLKRAVSIFLACVIVLTMMSVLPTVSAEDGVPSSGTYLEDMEIINSDRYTGNQGDSFIDVLGTRNGKTDIHGNVMEHGLEAWIARWNFRGEESWAWAEYALNGQYSTLTGKLTVIADSYNKTNFDSTIEIIGDGTILCSMQLTPNMDVAQVSVSVEGVHTLRIYAYDNVAVSGGTSFALWDFGLDMPDIEDPVTPENKFYKVYDLSMTWTEAKAYCESLGGHLVTITSEEEMNTVIALLGSESLNCYWIGLSRSDVNADWEWVTGETVSYTNWAEGEPNNDQNAGETYAHLFGIPYSGGRGIKNVGQWNDVTNEGASYASSHYELSNFGFICEWDSGWTEPSASNGFSAMKDGWSFVNGNEGFNYPNNYSIPEERYAVVLGSDYVAEANAYLKDGNKKKYKSMMPDWNGSCAGMSVTAVLYYLDMLNWEDYTEDFDTVNSYYSILNFNENSGRDLYAISGMGTAITELIEQYQILQYGTYNYKTGEDSTYQALFTSAWAGDRDEFKGWFNKKYTAFHNSSGSYIDDVFNKICDAVYNAKEPLLVSMRGEHGGHAVVIRTDKAPISVGNGWYRVYIYDPNTPYISDSIIQNCGAEPKLYYSNYLEDDRYIELNPEKNQWRYVGGISAGYVTTYWGSDKNDEVRYYEYGKTNDGTAVVIPELLWVYSIKMESNFPLIFDGDKDDRLWSPSSEVSTTIATTETATFTVYTIDGAEILSCDQGSVLASMDGVAYYPYIGNSLDGKGTTGGQIEFPYTDFIIEYMSGDDISILGNDIVMNMASSGKTTLTVNMPDGRIAITSKEDNEICAQITDVYSSSVYTSVVVNGTLEKDDTVTLQLKNDALKANITGDSEMDLTTDNDEKPDVRYIEQLDETDGTIEIGNVRENFPNEHTHELIHYDDMAATCTINGNVEYWMCNNCGRYYLDADGLEETKPEDVVISATGHTPGSEWESDAVGHWHLCEACGEKCNEENHSFVDLTCSACGYTMSGTNPPDDPSPTDPEPTDPMSSEPAPTNPEPVDSTPTNPEPTDAETTDPGSTDPSDTPQTGDVGIRLLFVLMLCSAVGITVLLFNRKKMIRF